MKAFNTKRMALNKNLEECKQKAKINETLGIMSKPVNKKVAVILDGKERKTTKALIKAGWNRKNIHIPNKSDDYPPIKKCHPNTYDMYLYDFLLMHRRKKKSIGLIYMDYMCTLPGNDECKPMDDLNLLFKNNMMATNCMLGITLSINRSAKNESGFIAPDIIKTISIVQELASGAKSRAQLITEAGGMYRNGGNMFTLLFKILK